MKEKERVAQLISEIDRLLRKGRPIHTEHPDDERLLEIAQALAEIDLSGESQRLGATRQYLVGMAASLEQEQMTQRPPYSQHMNEVARHTRRNHHERYELMRKSPLVAIFSIGIVTLAVIAFVGLVLVLPWLRRSEASAPGGETPTEASPTQVSTTYIVQEGDTLSSIASRFDTTVPAIMAANGIRDSGQLMVGMTLAIPAVPMPTQVGGQSFVPLSTLGLPNGVYNMLTEDLAGPGGQRMVFYNQGDDKFLNLIQRSALAGEKMPDGDTIRIGNADGVLQTGLASSITFYSTAERTINYTNGVGLTWNTDRGTRVGIISNLPQEDVISFAERLTVPITPFHVASLPTGFYASRGTYAVENGEMVTEDRYYGNEQFIILNQRPSAASEEMPGTPAGLAEDPMTIEPNATAQAIEINGLLATLIAPINGTAHIVDNTYFQDGIERTILGSGGGGGGGGGGGCDEEGNCSFSTPEPQLDPPTISFENGIRLVWVRDGVLIDMLSNLSKDDLLKVAEELEAGAAVKLVTGPEADRSVLPNGGVLAGYEIKHPSLPQNFYGQSSLTVTEGHGLFIENRYYSNDHFAIFTTQKDDGSPLPAGQPTKINQLPAALMSGLSGKALISLEKFGTLQDGKPRLILEFSGGESSSDADSVPLFPDSIFYTEGQLLTWVDNGARITLLSNLSEEEVLRMASEATILGKTYVFVAPHSLAAQGQIFTSGFNLWGPTYIPDEMDYIFPAVDQEGVPDILYTNIPNTDHFVRLAQRAAQPGENLPDGESIMLNGQTAILSLASGSLKVPIYPVPDQSIVTYDNAIQITWIVDGTWIQITTNVSREEAIRIAESMVPAE